MKAPLAAGHFLLSLILAALAACSPMPPAPSGRDAGAMLLAGGLVLDPASTAPPRRADVLVAGGKIVAVGNSLRLPSGARKIDVSGRYLLPGLWDMHAHVAAADPADGALEDYLAHGVLGIRDMGGRADELLVLRDAVASGGQPGPTMLVAGPTLNGEAAADFHVSVRNRAEAAAAVERLARKGVDLIKIHRRLSRDAFTGVSEAARRRGLTFAGHVPLGMSWIDGAAGGMASIEHVQTIVENELVAGSDPVKATFATLDRLDGPRGDEIFAAMARNRTRWTPTLIYYERSWRTDSPERRALKQQALARMRPLVARALHAGVTLLAGTDEVAADRGGALLDELSRLVEAGLSPRQAVAAATVNAFDLAARGPGPIRAGGEASLLVLAGNPLEDVAQLRRLDAVIVRGRLLDGADLERLKRQSRIASPKPPSPR